MKSLRFAAIIAISILLPLTGWARADPKPGSQTAEIYKAPERQMGYLLFLPEDYGKDPHKKWPVILFLHGSGEAGDGTTEIGKVAIHGPPKLAAAKKDFGFIVISPQNPVKKWWEPKMVKGLLDHVLANQPFADADRVYLTGLSLGGFGTWATAATYPKAFAAIAPVCGGGNPNIAGRIKDLPIWVFHGELDRQVPVDMSVKLVEALKVEGAKDVQFTRYPDKPHDCWTVTYENPKLYEWFLSHSLKAEK